MRTMRTGTELGPERRFSSRSYRSARFAGGTGSYPRTGFYGNAGYVGNAGYAGSAGFVSTPTTTTVGWAPGYYGWYGGPFAASYPVSGSYEAFYGAPGVAVAAPVPAPACTCGGPAMAAYPGWGAYQGFYTEPGYTYGPPTGAVTVGWGPAYTGEFVEGQTFNGERAGWAPGYAGGYYGQEQVRINTAAPMTERPSVSGTARTSATAGRIRRVSATEANGYSNTYRPAAAQAFEANSGASASAGVHQHAKLPPHPGGAQWPTS